MAKYRILHLLCCLGLLCQLQGVLREWIWPTHVITKIYEEELQSNPPVIYKICTSPGFNDTALNVEGYIDSFAYSIGSKMRNEICLLLRLCSWPCDKSSSATPTTT